MNGRDFQKSAQTLLAVAEEHAWRTVAGRAYYALLLEGEAALLRWGFPKPAGDQLHQFVRRRFTFTPHSDLKPIGYKLDALAKLRNEADYQLLVKRNFATVVSAQEAYNDAEKMIALIDAIDADPVRQADVIAALQNQWP